MSQVDIVVVSYNTCSLTINAIKSVCENTADFKVIVVDNASQDNSVNILRTVFKDSKDVEVVDSGSNIGYGRACNKGAKLGTSPYLIFMNGDCRVFNGWFQPIKEMLDRPQVFAVAPKLINDDGRIVGCGVVGTNSRPFFRGWMAPPQDERFNQEVECVTISGALFGCNREIFEELGGFDERFFHFYEETHLMYLARSKGYKVMYQPKSICYHKIHGSCRDRQKLVQYCNESKKIFEGIWGPTT